MKLVRLLLAPVALALVAGVATLAQIEAPAGWRMVDAAQKFVGGLTPEQEDKTGFAYDSPERSRWFFVPHQDQQKKPLRKGLRFEEMTAPQKEAALAFLQAGTSQK